MKKKVAVTGPELKKRRRTKDGKGGRTQKHPGKKKKNKGMKRGKKDQRKKRRGTCPEGKRTGKGGLHIDRKEERTLVVVQKGKKEKTRKAKKKGVGG